MTLTLNWKKALAAFFFVAAAIWLSSLNDKAHADVVRTVCNPAQPGQCVTQSVRQVTPTINSTTVEAVNPGTRSSARVSVFSTPSGQTSVQQADTPRWQMQQVVVNGQRRALVITRK